jgi:hypothetical protein
MDAETIEMKFAALEAVIARHEATVARLAAQLAAPKPSAEVICMKEAAARLGVSRHTLRRRAKADPSLGQKVGGRWQFHSEHLSI